MAESGADEAALTAVRASRTRLAAAAFADARDRAVLGTRDRGGTLTPEEMATVAARRDGHEFGRQHHGARLLR